jgi:ArsR family transcriptional regulator, lead/cadmium/zinc/bismuth-responsive transcriptional repressor
MRHMNSRSSVHARRATSRGAGGTRRRAPSVPPAAAEAVRRARVALADGERVERLARTFRALGDATRSKLVLALSIQEMCVGDLAHTLGASMSATSHQLRILRDLDIVRVRRSGKTQVYALNEHAFGFCAPRVCHAWRQTLDAAAPVRVEPRGGRD